MCLWSLEKETSSELPWYFFLFYLWGSLSRGLQVKCLPDCLQLSRRCCIWQITLTNVIVSLWAVEMPAGIEIKVRWWAQSKGTVLVAANRQFIRSVALNVCLLLGNPSRHILVLLRFLFFLVCVFEGNLKTLFSLDPENSRPSAIKNHCLFRTTDIFRFSEISSTAVDVTPQKSCSSSQTVRIHLWTMQCTLLQSFILKKNDVLLFWVFIVVSFEQKVLFLSADW